MSQIHILDGQSNQGEILDYITAKNIISDTHKKSKEDTLETYDFITFADKRFSEFLEKRNRIIIPDEDDTLREFVIFEAARYKDSEGYKSQIYTHASYLELKKASVLHPDKGYTGTASQHGGRALNNTGWQIGIVESKGTRTLTIENHTNPFAFLKRIAKEFELELRFRVEHDGNKITGRYVDLLERIGEWRGREAEFGKDLDGIRRVEKQDIVTALLGLGPEKEDGTRLEVLVEDEDALKRWGWEDRYGNINHWIEPYEIQSERSEMTESEARQYTRTALNKRINTQVTYEGSIVDLENVPGMENKKIRFGDTIRIKDTKFNPPLYLEARIFEQTRSIKSKAKKDIKLGDFVEFTEEEVNNIWDQLRKDIQKRVTAAEMAEYTYSKMLIDEKDEQIYEDGKTFAEATGIKAEENAKEFAVEEDKKIKVDVEDYADYVAEKEAESALSQAKQYAVAKEVYENEMDKIASDIEERAPLEYVDGEFKIIKDDIDDFNAEIERKADGSTVYTIEEVDNMINNTVSKTEYTADMDGIVTDIESHGTRIGQNEEAIGLKADSSYVDTVENSLNTKIGNVEVTAEGAKMSASEVRADLDGLEIGGRNLLKNSTTFNSPWDSEHSTGKKDPFGDNNAVKMDGSNQYLGYRVNQIDNIDKFTKGEYTLSFWAKSDSGESKLMRVGGRGGLNFVSSLSIPKEWTKFTFYSSIDSEISSGRLVYFDNKGYNTDIKPYKDIYIAYPQLEKGNKATDWSPAPEDIDESINQVGGRVEKLDASVETLAGEVSLKASQSIVDSLENQVENHEAELNVLPGQIELKADAAVVDGIDDRLGSAEIIIDGLESEIKLKADLVDIEGMLTADDLAVRGDLQFGGELTGATGVFGGKIVSPKLIVEVENKEQFDDFGLMLQTAEWRPDVDNPYEITGYIKFLTDDNGLKIFKEDLDGQREDMDAMIVNAKKIQLAGQIEVGAGSATGGMDDGIEFPGGHVISARVNTYDFIMYGNRAFGRIPFQIRSHNNRSSYRTDFWIRDDGTMYNDATQSNTSSRTSNVRIADDGDGNYRFYRSTSARKYKTSIKPIDVNPYNLLDIEPMSWLDKREVEENNGSTRELKRYYGIIANDLEKVGLSQYVDYQDGEVEHYEERAWTLLIPIVRDLKNELEELKNERGNL